MFPYRNTNVLFKIICSGLENGSVVLRNIHGNSDSVRYLLEQKNSRGLSNLVHRGKPKIFIGIFKSVYLTFFSLDVENCIPVKAFFPCIKKNPAMGR